MHWKSNLVSFLEKLYLKIIFFDDMKIDRTKQIQSLFQFQQYLFWNQLVIFIQRKVHK